MKQQAISPLRGALLGLIAGQPMSGYDLAKAFDTIARVWTAKHSQIYPELGAMLKDGLVTMRAAGTRGRKEYSVTGEGKQELLRWLTERPPQPPTSRHEGLLRSFFLGYLPVEQAQDLLRAERDRHIAQLEDYLERAAAGPPPDDPPGWTGDITLEAGIRYEKMMIGWYEWALAEIEGRPSRRKDASKRRQAAKRGRSRARS